MFNRNEHKTPKQKADKAIMNIFARLAGCGFLVYFVVKLFNTPAGGAPDATTATIMTIVLLVLSVVVIGITIMDLIRGIKEGRFKASTYEDADLAEYLEQKEAAAADCACEDDQQELEAYSDDETLPAAEESAPEEKDSEDIK